MVISKIPEGPGPREREIMMQMLAEDDPTNGVARSDKLPWVQAV